jgi:hypothetical protein
MARRPLPGRDNGIEALIAARRGATPTREELQQRTAALTAHLAPSAREGTPGEVLASDAQLARPSSARHMRMDEFEQALQMIEEGRDLAEDGGHARRAPDDSTHAQPLTAIQMANAVGEQLGLAAAPMTTLVERAKAALGLQLSGTVISQLRACHEHLAGAGADDDGAPATLAPPGGGSLLEGTFDEAESNASFAAALADFRGLPADERRKKKGPPLGERLLAKGLVSGCST